MRRTRWLLKRIFILADVHRRFGDEFANIGAREPQFKASAAFTKFGDAHRQIDHYATTLLKTIKPVRKKLFFQTYDTTNIILDDRRFKYIFNKSYSRYSINY
jgi:hypothetical protein